MIPSRCYLRKSNYEGVIVAHIPGCQNNTLETILELLLKVGGRFFIKWPKSHILVLFWMFKGKIIRLLSSYSSIHPQGMRCKVKPLNIRGGAYLTTGVGSRQLYGSQKFLKNSGIGRLRYGLSKSAHFSFWTNRAF